MSGTADAGSADLRRNAARIKPLPVATSERNFFSIRWCVMQLRSTRFSLSEDVVRFSGLIHLIPDQSSSLAGERSK
jgi:hypothetical protein